MVNHKRVQNAVRFSPRQTACGVIYGFIKTIFSFKSFFCQQLQVGTGLGRRYHQCHHGSIRCNDQILFQTTFQAKTGHAKSAVLIIQIGIGHVVGRLGNAPRHSPLCGIVDLSFYGGLIGLVQKCIFVGRHHQLRHQVLKHRPAPGEQNRIPARIGQ